MTDSESERREQAPVTPKDPPSGEKRDPVDKVPRRRAEMTKIEEARREKRRPSDDD